MYALPGSIGQLRHTKKWNGLRGKMKRKGLSDKFQTALLIFVRQLVVISAGTSP